MAWRRKLISMIKIACITAKGCENMSVAWLSVSGPGEEHLQFKNNDSLLLYKTNQSPHSKMMLTRNKFHPCLLQKWSMLIIHVFLWTVKYFKNLYLRSCANRSNNVFLQDHISYSSWIPINSWGILWPLSTEFFLKFIFVTRVYMFW